MEFISNCTADAISNAAKALMDGHLVAFPTETVYGLGADATNEKAVSRIYSVKGRPTDHPLIVHISSIKKLENWATNIPDYAVKLAREFWPGPMTLILPRKELAKDFITSGQDNVGLRVPDQPIALALLKKFEEMGGQGVAAPSANRFGAVSPTNADAVNEELGSFLDQNDLVLNGGPCEIGLESTIIDCRGVKPIVLRPGAITDEMIRQLVGGLQDEREKFDLVKAPGTLKVHYSPKAKVTLNAAPEVGDGFLGLKDLTTPIGNIRLSSPVDIKNFARILYASFRKADKMGLTRINVHIHEEDNLGKAIIDRVQRAMNK
jgi:L-threonylcarbamoyladenylate synthase